MKKLFSSKSGVSHIQTAVLVIIFAMIISTLLVFWNAMTIINVSRDNTTRVLDSFVTHNSIEIFNSLKNGSDFSEDLDKYFYKSILSDEFSLDLYGSSMYSYSENGKLIFMMTNPNVAYDYQNTLKLRAAYTVWIPMRFAGKIITYVRIPVTVQSYYNLKY
ncbi:MAG: hypothetical protein PHV32_05920 [Eubacteriales bacterium]|nr:hypothetical protein [Eubacteriales bacterium]